MTKSLSIFLFLFFCCTDVFAANFKLDQTRWSQVKDKHFVVIYPVGESEETPRMILRKAEEYYTSIADKIGYARYKDFWTWEERVQIIYFRSQTEFTEVTKQPVWSKAFSFSHLTSFQLRMIVSFKGQDNFLDVILPHEIGHLVLHDFMGEGKIPLWFDEGVAQLNEARTNDDEYKQVVAKLALLNKTLPFSLLEDYTLKDKTDQTQVAIFYAESLYIVDFLIKTYGSDAFRELCRAIRDGKSFEDALKSVYYPTVGSMAGLEDKWVQYMSAFVK